MHAGFVFTYGVLQISLWVLFHAIGVFLGIVFPFFYRKIREEGKIIYVHISTAVLAIVLPAIPALLHLIDGYAIASSSVDTCTGRNGTITYFTMILPISVVLASATTMLVIIFQKILKVLIVLNI